MEIIRQRFSLGRKVEDVKLRKRKSQLYVKEDDFPLINGGALDWCDITNSQWSL